MSDRVLIMGGGPAGAALGCYLSLAGVPNTLFEGAIHPRPHVGESLLLSAVTIFQELQLLEAMERAGFQRKLGASFHGASAAAARAFRVRFDEEASYDIGQPHSYHVDRARFDAMLLKHASDLGTEVYTGTRVERALFDGERARGVTIAIAGRSLDVEGSMVVDATGRSAILGRQLGLYERDPVLDQYATHAWFRGVTRPAGKESDIHIAALPENGWAWFIPITEEVTSVGVVVTRAAFKETRDDVEGWLRARLESTELGKDAARWQRVSDVRREGDYSYTMRRYCGPGWALIGDAARFVDPIFSSGVNVALYSARGCAKAITALRRDGADEAAILARYEQSVRAASDVWHEFVSLYYALKPLFVIFGQRAEYRRQIVAIIQGTVWELAEVPVLAEMRKFLDKVREDEGHMLHKHLGRV